MSVEPKLALVVEDDLSQREALADLLKLERMDVIPVTALKPENSCSAGPASRSRS